MAIILPNSVFFHFPKTGGYFIREVIKQSGVDYQEDNPEDHSFHNIDRDKLAIAKARLAFIFMRHPMDWYTSYWNHRIHVGWEGPLHPGWNAVGIYQSKGADTFTGFLQQVIDEGVPFISQHSALFEKMDEVGRLEHLREDLIRIFSRSGDPVSPDLIRAIPVQNKIEYKDGELFRVPASLYRKMIELEAWAMQFFHYTETSPRFRLV